MSMKAYLIKYTLPNSDTLHSQGIDAKSVESAKKKIERKENKRIEIVSVSIIGYY